MTSPNVAKIAALSKMGWRITVHEIKFSGTDNSLKEHVVLKRGNDTTFIEAQNDPELLEYLQHFEKFQDEFGNNQFVYVNDINSYKQRIQERLIQGTVPQRPIQITIGEFIIQNPSLYYLITPQLGSGPNVGEAYFFVNISKNQDFFRFDYRDQVKIIWLDTNEIAFSGFSHEVFASGDTALFLCSGGKRRLFESGLVWEPIGITAEDAFYFIAKSLGTEAIFEGGAKPLLKKRGFNVIFPVRGLILPATLRIEQVLFTKDISEFLTDNIKQSKTIENKPWRDQKSYAVVEVAAEHFFEAMVNAEEVAKRAINWIQFRIDISLPCIDEIEKTLLNYNMSKAFSKCYLLPYGLAVDSTTKGAIFNLLNAQSGHQLVFHHSPQDFFLPLTSIINKLNQINKLYSQVVQSLYEALSWLMQSFEMESPIDNLLQLWIAFEFICANERIPKVVSKANIDCSILAIQSLALPIEEEAALRYSISQINNRPLMEKWNKLLLRLEITLTESEKRLVSKLRKERNYLEHGERPSKLSIEELEKFRSILERVFIKKANVLVESYYGVQDLSLIFGQ